jgi:hypothetical protein
VVINGTWDLFLKLFSEMLPSRIFTLGVLKYPNRFVLSYSKCCLANFSSTTSAKTIINVEKQTDDNNEWLWAYLRDRKTFSDLNEQQRRRVIEIG